ncbi:RING finger protein nhl-1-like [Exaiptasia diaphana]|uniref:RING-type domain-containing protein n=1 Tax=Exaiptasia diaphana TaxID=2652724 RepID=A0A913X3G3_EXADI|nr:RING finger protein nhl-1-like [Exaiptasia diaphana]
MAASSLSITDDLEAQLTCAICNDIFTDPRTLVPCLHTFCFNCIKSWNETCEKAGKRLRCPTCRLVVNIEGGDISKLPSSFQSNSLLQLYQKCIAKSHCSHDKVKTEKLTEDAKKLIREDMNRLNELIVEYRKELELSDENMRRIQSETDTEKAKVRNNTRALMKILQDHDNTSIAILEKNLVEQRRANEDEKSEVNAHIQQIFELKHQFEKLMSEKQFRSEDYENLQVICKAILQNKSILSTKPVKRNSSLCYKPNPEGISFMENLKFGEVVESVTDPSRCSIESVSNVRCGFINEFRIVTRNSEGNVCYTNKGSIDVQIQDVDGYDVQKELTETETGRFLVKYRAEKPSPYKVVVSIGGEEIKNSPQNIETIDAKAEFKPLRLIDLKEMSEPIALSVSDTGEIAVRNDDDEMEDFSVKLFSADGEYVREIGGTGSGHGQLSCPFGVFFNGGQILVSDIDPDNKLCGCIKEFDINGTYSRTLCKQPKGIGITGMCKVNQNYMAYLSHNADTKDTFIKLFAQQNGDHLTDIKLDVPNGGHGIPFYLDYDNNKYFVKFLDMNTTVYVFNEDGRLLYSFGEKGNTDGQFDGVSGLAVFGKEMLLVCDYSNNCVQVFSQDGQFIRSFGSFGSGLGQMDGPIDVAVTPDGRVLVLECKGNRVQVWRYFFRNNKKLTFNP